MEGRSTDTSGVSSHVDDVRASFPLKIKLPRFIYVFQLLCVQNWYKHFVTCFIYYIKCAFTSSYIFKKPKLNCIVFFDKIHMIEIYT